MTRDQHIWRHGVIMLVAISIATSAVFAWGFVFGRLVSLAVGLVLVAFLVVPSWRTKHVIFPVASLWLVVSLSPVVVTFKDVPGPMRFVPYVISTLTKEGQQAEARGEFVGGGCIAFVFPPRWALVG